VKRIKRIRKSDRQFVERYTSSSFEVVQIELKHIIDLKALSASQITHIPKEVLPLYQ
jgi:diphthamide biosynthesis methyltransferase